MTKTTQYKNIPIGTIPNDWEVKKLGEVGEISSGGTPSTTVEEYWNGDINWCTPTDISALSSEYLDDTTAKITEAGLKNSSAKILPPNSIIVCTRATIGKAAINSQPMSTNQGFKNIIPVGINHKFLYYKILAEENGLKRIANGSTFLEVSKSDFENYHISLPPLPEQQKIADVLSTWDKAIQETDAIIKKLEDRNKALAFSLLTGKKRVKNKENSKFHKTNLGSKYPIDWEIKTVKTIFKERKEKSNDQSKYPLFSLTIEKGLTEKTDRYERSFLLKDQESNEYKLIYPNDILFNPMNLRFGAIAKSNIDEIVSVSAYYNSIYKTDENVNLDYYTNLFKTDLFINLYDRIAIGSLLEKKRVHLSNFLELEIPFPSLKEQNAIAEILNTANQEVKQYQQKLEALKLQKKGLMQQLLTGKVRTV